MAFTVHSRTGCGIRTPSQRPAARAQELVHEEEGLSNAAAEAQHRQRAAAARAAQQSQHSPKRKQPAHRTIHMWGGRKHHRRKARTLLRLETRKARTPCRGDRRRA